MYKKILVALDGSETSNLALKEAIQLAKENNSKIRGVYVVDANHVTPELEFVTFKEMISSMRDEARSVLAAAQKKMNAAGVSGDTKICETDQSAGRIAEAIAKEAKNWPANLIIVGTHGRRGFSRFLLGSVAELLVRVATKPVMLIRPKDKK